MSVTVRGNAKVEWKPAYTLAFTSEDGTSLETGTTTHNLIATLTNTVTGLPVANRQIRLTTNPVRIGNGYRKTTNAEGKATFAVSNPSVEAVIYTAGVIPVPATSEPTVETSLTINWGGVVCTTCNANVTTPVAEKFPPGDPQGVQWFVQYDVVTTSGDACEISTSVSHTRAHVSYISVIDPSCDQAEPGFGIPSADVVEVLCDSEIEPDADLDAIVVTMQAEADAFVATLNLDPC